MAGKAQFPQRRVQTEQRALAALMTQTRTLCPTSVDRHTGRGYTLQRPGRMALSVSPPRPHAKPHTFSSAGAAWGAPGLVAAGQGGWGPVDRDAGEALSRGARVSWGARCGPSWACWGACCWRGPRRTPSRCPPGVLTLLSPPPLQSRKPRPVPWCPHPQCQAQPLNPALCAKDHYGQLFGWGGVFVLNYPPLLKAGIFPSPSFWPLDFPEHSQACCYCSVT